MVFLLPKVELGSPNGAQLGPGKTQREKIFEAVEALRLLLGQGVCSQVEDSPAPKGYSSPFPD